MRVARIATMALALGFLLVAAAWWWLWRVPGQPAPELSGTLHEAFVAGPQGERSFTYYVPQRVNEDPRLLLVLHGAMMSGRRMREATGHMFDVLADRHGFVVAYPDAVGGNWNDCRSSTDFEAKRRRIDDVAFLRTVTRVLADELRLEWGAILAAGYSNGAHMNFRLAAEAPELVRGIAVLAANLPTAGNWLCPPLTRPVRVIVINGTADPVNPFAGGETALFGVFLRRGTVVSSDSTARYFADLAGHRSRPSEMPLPDADPDDGTTSVRQLWSDAGKEPVMLVRVAGGGHTIPHPHVMFPRLLGRTSHDFAAADLISSFLSLAPERQAD